MVIWQEIVCINAVYELSKGHYSQFLCLPLLIKHLENKVVPIVKNLCKDCKTIETFFCLHYREQSGIKEADSHRI